MPQILVVADSPEDTTDTVVYRERISCEDLESAHFSGQLVERVGWAVRDANQVEHAARGVLPLVRRRGSSAAA